MSTIDPTTRLLAQIRAQAHEWRGRVGAQPGLPAPGKRSPAEGTQGPRDWMAQVAEAVVAIEPADPDRRRKAFRIYLRAVLARECGIQRTDDQGFQDLVERVQQTMEADPRLKEAIEAAGDMLVESGTA